MAHRFGAPATLSAQITCTLCTRSTSQAITGRHTLPLPDSHSLSLGAAKMMKQLYRVLEQSRNQLSRKPLNWKGGDLRDVLRSHAFSYSTAGQNFAGTGSNAGKIFAPYTIFKGKAALSMTPVLPTFTKLESGSLVVDRRGSLMLKFIPAIGERKYDHERRQIFSLSATEVGSLISLGADDSCEFFHDPSMLSSNAGQVRKSLSIKPHGNGTGYFISLTVVNNVLKTKDNFSVPVTSAEFAVMKTACSFALPHIMGWDRLTNKTSRGIEGQTSSLVDRQMLSSEWDK